MTPDFLYFDLGHVLLHFDHRRAARQMAALAGVSPDLVWQVVFAEGLEFEHESGAIDEAEFYEIFCRRTGTRPNRGDLFAAGADIFDLNLSLAPVVAQLGCAGWPLGVFSNTSPSHWAHCTSGRFGILLGAFRVFALSYELLGLKPQPQVYARAAALAGVPPASIFFVDDREENVTAARQAGWDAVAYTTTPALVAALGERGVKLNF